MKTLKEIQNDTRQLMKTYHLNANLENRYISLASELGELGKEIVKGNRYGSQEFVKTENFEMELGDVFFDYILLCNVANIDIEEALQKTYEKCKKRFLDHGTIGSSRIKENNIGKK